MKSDYEVNIEMSQSKLRLSDEEHTLNLIEIDNKEIID